MGNYVTIEELRAAPYSITEAEAANPLLTIYLELTKALIDGPQLCNQYFDKQSKTLTLDGTGRETIFLYDRAVSITSITDNGTAITVAGCLVYPWYIIYEDDNFSVGNQNIVIVGDFGYSSVPPLIRHLQAKLICNLVRSSGVGAIGSLKSENIGDYSYTLFDKKGLLKDEELNMIVKQYKHIGTPHAIGKPGDEAQNIISTSSW